MRWTIATASARCSLVITALLVSQFSAVSESCAAKALRITDDDWARSSGLSKPRAMAASMTGSGISTVSRRKPSGRRWRWRRTRSVLGLKECGSEHASRFSRCAASGVSATWTAQACHPCRRRGRTAMAISAIQSLGVSAVRIRWNFSLSCDSRSWFGSHDVIR
jgi:hypothetical protein